MGDKIQHVVVLMLENRFFDSMLGRLYPDDPDFCGLTLGEYNTFAGTRVGVWSGDGTPPCIATMPTPDPGETFKDIAEQLQGDPNAPSAMGGFAVNYATQK